MPHIFIRMMKGCTPEQKRKLAVDTRDAVNRHLDEIPSHVYKGIIECELIEFSSEDFAKGGKTGGDNQRSAYVIIYTGRRTPDQKRGIYKDVTKAVVENLRIPSEKVMVELVDLSPENISHGGKLTIDNPFPGIRLPGDSMPVTEKKN